MGSRFHTRIVSQDKDETINYKAFLLFILILIIIPGILKICGEALYKKTFCLGWLLLARIADLFFNENITALYLLAFLLFTISLFICPGVWDRLTDVPLHIKRILFAVLLFTLLCLCNLLRKDIYTIAGNKINKFESVLLIAKDSLTQETEIVEADDFSLTSYSVYYSGGRGSSGHTFRYRYLSLPNGYTVPLASSLTNEFKYLSEIQKTTRFTVYKNSKIPLAVDDIPLRDLVDNVERPTTRFELTLHPDGTVSITQPVILKTQPDIADRCQVCFEKNGELRAGFSVKNVMAGTRDATWLSNGIYRLYIRYGEDIISNIVTYEKKGNTFHVLE